MLFKRTFIYPISLIMVNKISRKIVLIFLSKSKYASEINEIKARYKFIKMISSME